MYDFVYVAPDDLDEAVAQRRLHEESKYLAGGMSLLSAMKLRLNRPSHLIDLRRLGGLVGIRREDGHLVIGAMTRHVVVTESDYVRTGIPALAMLAGGIGDRQVRNRGTIGGSLANADPAACYPAGLMGLGGDVVTTLRTIPADAFFVDLFETALYPGELIREVRFRIPERAAYAKWKQPASRFAQVGIMVSRSAEGTHRVGVTGARAHAYRESAIEALLDAGGSAVDVRRVELEHDDFNSDLHADAGYRGHLVTEIAARAVETMADAR